MVSKEEDVGIDGRDDAAELAFYLAAAGVGTEGLSVDEMRARFRDLPQYDDRDPGDPEGDNWHYDSSRNRDDYSRINGTEGNRNTEAGTRPDTEDLNNDGILNRSNDYYHHVIDLSDGGHVPGSESPAGWRLYRRPLFDERVERVGSPDSSRVEYGRLTLAGGSPPPEKPPSRWKSPRSRSSATTGRNRRSRCCRAACRSTRTARRASTSP